MSFTFKDLFAEGNDDTQHPAASGSTHPSQAPGGDSARESNPFGSAKPSRPQVSVEVFLVREILPFIPPAIVAPSGFAMEQKVEVPMQAGGSREVKLSTLYQACPDLFAAEITPLNDSSVVLPAREGGEAPSAPAASPFAAPAEGAFRAPVDARPAMEEPTAETAPTRSAAPEEPADNPFWSPAASTLDDSPPSPVKEEPAQAEAPESPAAFSGWGSADSEKPAFDPSGFAAPAPAKETSPPEGFGEPSSPESASSAFSGEPAGFENFVQPEADDKEAGFSTMFSEQAKADSEIPFPTPSAAVEPSSENGSEVEWGTLFNKGDEPQDEAKPETPKSDPVKAEPEAKPEAAPSRFSDAPSATAFSGMVSSPEPAETESEAPTKKAEDEPAPVLEPADPAPAASSFSAAFEAPAKAETSSPLEGFETSEPSVAEESVTDLQEKETESVNIEVSETKRDQPVISTSVDMVGPEEVSEKDLELRAIFSSDESFTLAKIARSIIALQGVAACTLATPERLVQASKSGKSKPGNQAKEMVNTIQSLAKLTGMPEARSFTLHTDCGVLSLFLEGDCCVTIHHDADPFGPGVREKLIIVARNLVQMEE